MSKCWRRTTLWFLIISGLEYSDESWTIHKREEGFWGARQRETTFAESDKTVATREKQRDPTMEMIKWFEIEWGDQIENMFSE